MDPGTKVPLKPQRFLTPETACLRCLPRYSDTTLKALTRITYLVLSLMTAAVPPTLSQESDHQPRTAASTLRKGVSPLNAMALMLRIGTAYRSRLTHTEMLFSTVFPSFS